LVSKGVEEEANPVSRGLKLVLISGGAKTGLISRGLNPQVGFQRNEIPVLFQKELKLGLVKEEFNSVWFQEIKPGLFDLRRIKSPVSFQRSQT